MPRYRKVKSEAMWGKERVTIRSINEGSTQPYMIRPNKRGGCYWVSARELRTIKKAR